MFKARLECNSQQAVVGIVSKRSQPQWISEDAPLHGQLWLPSICNRLDVYIYFFPCICLHVLLTKNERVMTSDEYELQLTAGGEE